MSFDAERQHSAPRFRMPAGACDCHMHVFGPQDRYALAPVRSYTPPPAELPDYMAMARRLGLERVVLVQPSAYGTDNSCMLDALRRIQPQARAIAVLSSEAHAKELEAMDRLGVRGIRVNAASHGVNDPAKVQASLERLADRIAPFGWHIQVFAAFPVIAAMLPVLAALPVPVVVDHMGLPKDVSAPDHPDYAAFLRLVAEGKLWVKLSGADRISETPPDFPEAAPFARALIAANSARLVWGTDWPHIAMHGQSPSADAPVLPYRTVDDGRMLDLLALWTGDDATLHRILVDNPAHLYGF